MYSWHIFIDKHKERILIWYMQGTQTDTPSQTIQLETVRPVSRLLLLPVALHGLCAVLRRLILSIKLFYSSTLKTHSYGLEGYTKQENTQ